MAHTRFFSRHVAPVHLHQAVKAVRKPVFVDVGGDGDCGFRAVAAGIVDNFLTNPRANQELLKFLLERHFKLFPSPQPAGRLLTPVERVREMVNTPVRMAEFIRNFAFTLRQIAVDEMVAYPELYRGAFSDNDENTSPENMRKQGTWIDESAIAALSAATNLPIEVRVVEQNKEIPLTLHYGDEKVKAADPVTVQLQNKHYIPQVSQANLFEAVKIQPVVTAIPVIDSTTQDLELSEILKRIEASDKQLVDTFNQYNSQLTSMLKAGEINKTLLLDIYIKGMNHSDYLQGRIRHVGLENGNQKFFAEAIEKHQHNGSSTVIALEDNESHDERVTKELIHAISRAMSIEQLDPDMVFDAIENTAEKRLSPTF